MKLIISTLFLVTIFPLSSFCETATDAQLLCPTLEHISGESKNICDTSGNSFIVLEFFSASCPHCKRNVEPFKKLEEKVKGLAYSRLISINNLVAAKNFAQQQNISTDMAIDPSGIAQRAYRITKVPSIFVLNQNQNIIYRHYGVLNENDIEAIYNLVKRTK
ncbi:MAG: TlpA family protein disulfide reductase [Myxococcales bacterium]|nr:TlpA family protein disulfide reductase [Myxococcales bacterium]USN50857.1 MAG: TlpA family protein disulfide reductase [Myxococcales bacterium]